MLKVLRICLNKMRQLVIFLQCGAIFLQDRSFTIPVQIDFIPNQEEQRIAVFHGQAVHAFHFFEGGFFINGVDHDTCISPLEIQVAHILVLGPSRRVPHIQCQLRRSTLDRGLVHLFVQIGLDR